METPNARKTHSNAVKLLKYYEGQPRLIKSEKISAVIEGEGK